MNKITNIFPIIGGAGGAFEAVNQTSNSLPSLKSILIYIFLTSLGALVGYLIKMLLDRIFKKIKK